MSDVTVKITCGECDSPTTKIGRYLFCTKRSCSMYGREVIDDNVARTETGAKTSSMSPAPATASPETRESCVASVPSSRPARRVAAHDADLSGLVSSARPITTTARVGAQGDHCDECHERIQPHAQVVLYASEPGAPAKMLHPECFTVHLAKVAA